MAVRARAPSRRLCVWQNDWPAKICLGYSLTELKNKVKAVFSDDWVRDGGDQFQANIGAFGGVDFSTHFVESTEATPDFLLAMDSLREGIGLRGYGQKDPLIEYKREGFDMFAAMMDRCKQDVLEHLFRVQVVPGEQPPPVLERPRRPPALTLNRGEQTAAGNEDKTIRRSGDKVGRNDPCPCGSGKKYKKCHGA